MAVHSWESEAVRKVKLRPVLVFPTGCVVCIIVALKMTNDVRSLSGNEKFGLLLLYVASFVFAMVSIGACLGLIRTLSSRKNKQ